MTFRVDQEISDRNSAESGLTTRIDKEIVDREDAISEIKSRYVKDNLICICHLNNQYSLLYFLIKWNSPSVTQDLFIALNIFAILISVDISIKI